ncbi:MAG: prepilin peptidase [Terracidiphilus sp.]|jgi:leader peptidase (prepilin peptidase)/N-methyltransferase
MMRLLGTVFAGLLGLAFGSFLNVCLSRWPAGESIVTPRSHCRQCGRTLAWWENVPLVSWLALRGRCRTCRAWIGWRYPLVELAIGALWAYTFWGAAFQLTSPGFSFASEDAILAYIELELAVGTMAFFWLLIGLAVLDAEHFWLPDLITLPGIALGIIFRGALIGQLQWFFLVNPWPWILKALGGRLLSVVLATSLILLIRWLYWLIRRREGIGLGDAKLMAMLAAWLGLPGALLAFGLGVVLGALVAVVLLAIPAAHSGSGAWALKKLPLGTFLCVGGIASGLWGQQIIAAYLRWAGF